MSVTQVADVTATVTTQVEPPTGENVVALIGVREGSATVAANVVKEYITGDSSRATTDFGSGSDMATGVGIALRNGAAKVLAVGVGARSGSPFTETFGNASAITSFTLNTARLPIRLEDISAAARDGTNILSGVKFTTEDPATLSPAAGEVYINPVLGTGKLGTATSGASSGFVITYASYDWDAAWDALTAFGPFEVAHIPNEDFIAGTYGTHEKVAGLCAEDERMIVMSLVTGITPAQANATDFKVTAIDGGHVAKYARKAGTGDFGTAMAARLAREPANATLKDQTAPLQGVTYTDFYSRSEFGDDADPASGTLHYLGVNAIYRDPVGTARITSHFSGAGLSASDRWLDADRMLFNMSRGYDNALFAFRSSSGTAGPYNEAGLSAIKQILADKSDEYVDAGWIEPDVNVIVPALSSISASDKAKRKVPGLRVQVRLSGQTHTYEISLEGSLA